MVINSESITKWVECLSTLSFRFLFQWNLHFLRLTTKTLQPNGVSNPYIRPPRLHLHSLLIQPFPSGTRSYPPTHKLELSLHPEQNFLPMPSVAEARAFDVVSDAVDEGTRYARAWGVSLWSRF
jgi:hypothetical protein